MGGIKPGKRGRGAEGKELFDCSRKDRERKWPDRLKHIPDASGPTLEKAIDEMVSPGSTIRTDGWRGYSKLEQKGYAHIVLVHEEQKPGKYPTPLVVGLPLFSNDGSLELIKVPNDFHISNTTLTNIRSDLIVGNHDLGKHLLRLVQQVLQVDPIIREKLTFSS